MPLAVAAPAMATDGTVAPQARARKADVVIEAGQDAFRRRACREAHTQLSAADWIEGLRIDDLKCQNLEQSYQ